MLKTVQIGGHRIKLTQYLYNRINKEGEATVPELYFIIMGSLGGYIDLPLIPQVNKTYRAFTSRLAYLIKKGGVDIVNINERDHEYRKLMKYLLYCLRSDISTFEAEYRNKKYVFRVLTLRDILKHSYLSFFMVAERLAIPHYIDELTDKLGIGRSLIETYLKVMRMYRLIKSSRGRYVFRNKELYLRVREAGEVKKYKVLDKLIRYSKAIRLHKEGKDLRQISKSTGFSIQYLNYILNKNVGGNRILLYAYRLYEDDLLPLEDYETLERFIKSQTK
jgi:hypothetical protein